MQTKKQKVTDEAMILFWKLPSPFCQWSYSEFIVDEVKYCTAEQYMMAEKARLFGDEGIRALVMSTRDPRKQKELGRKVRGFNETVWKTHMFDIVVKGNLAKFSQNPTFRTALLATGTKVLAEASPYDKVWGIGMSADNPRAWHRNEWRGENLLGEALMKVRDQLSVL